VIDLGGVVTPERLRAALSQHFDLPPDIREMSCAISLVGQECPYHIEFRHWATLEQHMPRYARRLKRLLEQYARWHPQALVVQYDSSEVPRNSDWPSANSKRAPAEGRLRELRDTAPQTQSHSLPSVGGVLQRLSCVVLEPVAVPHVEQIRTLRDLGRLGDLNMLEIRRRLVQGGSACFGELLDDQAREVSSRLSAVGIPHRIEKTPIREIIFPKGKTN
jgi:hypothetical protein